jgi:hypothetical protein
MTEASRVAPFTPHSSLITSRLGPHRRTTGGGERDRTDDLLLAKQALSQLSYTPPRTHPALRGGSGWVRTNDPRLIKTVL